VLPPSTPLTMRQPNFALPQVVGRRPQVVARRRHSTSPSMTPSRASRVARRGGKQCPQWIMAMADYDGGNDEEAGDSCMWHAVTAARSGKCQAQLPIDHFK
jgi:hypothetical protein